MNKVEIKKEKTDILETTVVDVEVDAVIVSIQGWRIRVYGDDLNLKLGQNIFVEYSGDLEDVHSVKLLGLVK